MADSILFVSMDGQGVKSSVIRAHAARKGHQRSRLNTAKQPSKAQSASAKNQASPPVNPLVKTKPRRKPARPKTKVEAKPKQSPKLTSVREAINEELEARDEQLLVVTSKKESPSPFQIWLPSCMSDRYVQMFFETMMPSYTAAYDVFNVPNIIKQEWPLYMNHEVFLWTEASAIQGLYESLQNPDKPPSQKVLLYQAKALSCLKQELLKTKNGQLDDYLVMSIFVLAALSLMAGDEVAHNAHKTILRTAFAAAGGLHNYGSFVRNTTMRLDSFWRSTADEPKEPAVPLLLPSRLPKMPSHPFAPELCTIVGNLPVGFQELAIQRKLPLDILEVLARISNPSQKPLSAVLSESSGSSQDNRSPATQCGMYVDFWESCPSLSSNRKDANGEPPLERLLSLALLIYATNRDGTNPLRMYNCITNGAIYDLHHDLSHCEVRRSKEEEHCLFWIWTVTIDAMRNRFGELTAQGEQLLEQQKKRFPGMVGTEKEEKLLQRFWFASNRSNGSCLFVSNSEFVQGRGKLRREGTNISTTSRRSDCASSPGASGGLSFDRTESMDDWSVTTPRAENEVADFEHVRSNSSQIDETESVVSKWHGPGFGLLPKGSFMEEVPELGYGKIGRRRKQSPVRCLAG
ncbi:hypothetical protein LTR64_003426 [Lithohypha guttulata]|uniref:uncharacterized protein n=1 Tax=Lithohypha guttulata TaxID=1690604 RepID=UPI00315D9C2E